LLPSDLRGQLIDNQRILEARILNITDCTQLGSVLAFTCNDVCNFRTVGTEVGRLIANPHGSCYLGHLSWIRAPSLHRHYPDSSVVRTHPPSASAGAGPHGFTIGVTCHCHPTEADFPCSVSILCHACCHHYPGGTSRCSCRSLP
jgi:hypothetical protein